MGLQQECESVVLSQSCDPAPLSSWWEYHLKQREAGCRMKGGRSSELQASQQTFTLSVGHCCFMTEKITSSCEWVWECTCVFRLVCKSWFDLCWGQCVYWWPGCKVTWSDACNARRHIHSYCPWLTVWRASASPSSFHTSSNCFSFSVPCHEMTSTLHLFILKDAICPQVFEM